MARKQTAEIEPEQKTTRRGGWRWWLFTLAVCTFAVSAIYAVNRVERQLMRDPRFLFHGPQDPGEESKNLIIEGAGHASRQDVIHVFEKDFGRSLYEVPIAERSRLLLAVNWVKQASVLRVWPNQIRVKIEERTPVAFVQVEGEKGASRAAMIDAEGVIVEQRNAKEYKLPVLLGIRESQSSSERQRRVRRMMKLIEEMGSGMAKISEVDASDAENLKLTQQIDGRAVLLIIGNQGYRARFDNFQDNYPEIHKRMPEATTFDLRLEDRITVIPKEGGNVQ